MTKKLMVLPKEVRKRGTIKLGTIPINTYDKTVEQELR